MKSLIILAIVLSFISTAKGADYYSIRKNNFGGQTIYNNGRKVMYTTKNNTGSINYYNGRNQKIGSVYKKVGNTR